MKSFLLILVCFYTIVQITAQNETTKKPIFPILKGDYFGFKPPGNKAKIFAPGILSTEFHDDAAPVFGRNEAYFRILFKKDDVFYGKIFYMKQVNGIWLSPQLAKFSTKQFNGNIHLQNNGKTLYWGVNNGENGKYNFDIAKVERVGNEWGKIINVVIMNGPNTELSVIEDNNFLYWSSEAYMNDPNPKLFRVQIKGDKLKNKETINWFPDSALVDIINEKKGYAIYTMKSKSNGYDLFISFKISDGNWASPINMGANINSPYMEKGARLTSDGKYLFFVSNRKHENDNPAKLWKHPALDGCKEFPNADIYWINASIIEILRKKTGF